MNLYLIISISGGLLLLAVLTWNCRRSLTKALWGEGFSTLTADLEESEARNQLLFKHANAIFYTIDSAGLFTYVSPSWTTFLGYSSEEMVGRSYQSVVLAEDIPKCEEFLTKVVNSGQLQSGAEYQVRHADGRLFWHMSSIMPVLGPDNRTVTYVGVAHDITGAKQVQEKLRLANQNLSAVIARREAELREAVRSTLSATEDEMRRVGQEIHDSLCQELVGLLRMAENLGPQPSPVLTEQIAYTLQVARGISYNLTLHELESLSLPDALALFVSRFNGLPGTLLELNCDPDLMTFTQEESRHIYRVIREAVVNAIRHGKARHIWIDLVLEGQQIVVSVSNDGAPPPADSAQVQGMGLKQIMMRANLLDARFTLTTNTLGKTIAELVIPADRLEKDLWARR
jgi:PAS domain S-box-containing protein